jgi:vacuolar-type H+-ATPase subunit H
MQLLIDLLKEQGTTEEYQEALDLIYRLIKCPKDPAAATANSELILLQKADNIELLLELLEHKDMVVGITTSQILTEVHTSSGPLLEKAIQDCHTGMNKLLQRLPDSAREEIRNQAIVLVQQLTANNEEMKKTVAFNEVVYYTHIQFLSMLCSSFTLISFSSSTARASTYFSVLFIVKEVPKKPVW